MSYREESRERRQTTFRTAMDIGMGVFYTAIGGIMVYARSFGRLGDIPPAIAYLLGGMMIVGGVARFYRGIKFILPKKRDTGINTSE